MPVGLGKPLDLLKHHDWRIWYQSWLYAAAQAVGRERFDAVISVSLSSLLFHNPLFRANADVRVIAGTGPLHWPKASRMPVRERALAKARDLAARIAVRSLKHWDRVVPANQTTSDWLSEAGLAPCRVERDVGLWELPPPTFRGTRTGRVVAHSNSFFMPRKGLAHAVQLFRELPSLSLDIFGRDSNGRVASILRGAPANIQWHGEVPRQRLLAQLPGYDAIFIPSLRDAVGTPTLEALALGIPVVHFRGSGPEELLGERAGLALTADLSLARREILALPAVIQEWTEQRAALNRARASENLWPAKARRLLDELLGPAAGPAHQARAVS
jgi:glycosyltransferase involved in cell wall biosynthesis